MSVAKHTYELTYIVNAVISDDQVKEVVSRVSSYISESGGEILRADEWGSQRLAFPIQKKRNGYYVNMYFRASGSLLARLERAMEIDDNILRYLTLRMDAKMLRHFESGKSAMPYREDAGRDKPKARSTDKVVPVKSETATAEPAASEPVAAVVAAVEPVAEEPVTAETVEAPVDVVTDDTAAVEVVEEVVEEVVAEAVMDTVAEEPVAETVVETVAEEVVAEEATAEAAPIATVDEVEPETTGTDTSSEETKRGDA